LTQFRAVKLDGFDKDAWQDCTRRSLGKWKKWRSDSRSNSKYGDVVLPGMELEEQLELVKDLESRVLRKRRHEPFELEVRNEDEAVLLKSILNKTKVELFQEMSDELERHIIECPECFRSETAPVHERMYEMYDTGDGVKENVFKADIEFKCRTCMKTVRGKSVVALRDRIDEYESGVREYVLEAREALPEPSFIEDVTEEQIHEYKQLDDQYAKLLPPGVDSLEEWYSQFEQVEKV
jgi:hypothetical protein